MNHVIRIGKNGGPEVLEWAEVEVGKPGQGEALVRHTAIGVNFMDIYYRKGVYKTTAFPIILGGEAAGIIESVGSGVSGLTPGDRVAYSVALGGYSERRLIGADGLVQIPDGIDDRTVAAGFLKGLTVECLLHRTFKVGKDTTVLWHAAAGGVGAIACRWAHALGATVIGTVGSEDKIALARANHCDHVIDYRREDFVARVREITGGTGVDVVYDSVGRDTFPGSLDCLRPMGMWVSFGQSSGLPPEFPISLLQQKGSLFATRPTITHYLARREALESSAAALFEALRKGTIHVAIGRELPLREAAEAHRAIEARRTTGSTILIP